MDRNKLFESLSEYGNSVNNRTANTTNFIDIKNKIRQAYDAGNIDKELMKELSDKASGAFKNMGRSPELESLPGKILQKGGTVSGIEGMTSRFASSPAESNVSKLGGKFGKTLKALGILAPGIAAMGIGEKAMAGDFGAAGMEGADLATDYIPGVGQVKDAIRPIELGNSELPQEEMMARAKYNEQARRGMGQLPEETPEQLEIPEKQNNRFSFLNKLK